VCHALSDPSVFSAFFSLVWFMHGLACDASRFFSRSPLFPPRPPPPARGRFVALRRLTPSLPFPARIPRVLFGAGASGFLVGLPGRGRAWRFRRVSCGYFWGASLLGPPVTAGGNRGSSGSLAPGGSRSSGDLAPPVFLLVFDASFRFLPLLLLALLSLSLSLSRPCSTGRDPVSRQAPLDLIWWGSF